MKKWIIATFMTIAAIGASTGAQGTAPASEAADPVAYGGCRWDCSTTGVRYLSAEKCDAACAGFCEPIC